MSDKTLVSSLSPAAAERAPQVQARRWWQAYAGTPLAAYLALAVGIVFLTFSGFFVRWADAPGVVTSFFRMGIATTLLAPLFLPRARRCKLSWPVLLPALAAGVFSGLDHATWSTALGMTRIANATLLNNTAPLWVALVALLVFRERLKGIFWAGLALTMAGAALVMGSDLLLHPTVGAGDLIALLSGLFYAAYYLITQRGRESLNALVFVGLINTMSALTLLAISLAAGMPLTGFSGWTYLAFIGAAVVAQNGGHFLLVYALGRLPASLVAPTMIGQPVMTALLAIPFFGEMLNTYQWVGGAAVLAGIYLVNRSRPG